MAKKKQKYYVVWSGNPTGVHNTWDACKKAVAGIPGAQFMGFETLREAKVAYGRAYADYKGKSTSKEKKALTPAQKAKYGMPDLFSLAVDAASSGNPGLMEYRGVDTQTHKQLFRQGPFKQGTNNIGEFLALVHGIAFLKQKGSDRIIYTDSRIAMGWVKKKKCNTKLKQTAKNKPL
ncbi:MAG: viroplasmin family protein, partial [Marinirhabdus sp.]